MNRIPIFDLKSEIDLLHEDLMKSIEEVLRSGHFIMGENVKSFEKEVASYLGVKHAIGVNSGTDALVIGLKAAGVGQGDEVITTPFTFFATAESIHQVGAKPVFVDVDEETFTIDPANIEAAITPRTKAILPVHLYGLSADMSPILELADKYNLKVVEDVAQAFGGEHSGKKLGTIGNVGCFSFFPTKNLGSYGDGGLIATDDDQVAEIAKMLRIHGSLKKYQNEMFGYNSRLDELQAAILRVKLPHLEQWNQRRREVASIYYELLHEESGIRLPSEPPHCKHVFHQYTIRVLDGKRDQLKQYLDNEGIGTMVYYPIPVHRLPVYQGSPSLPVSEKLASQALSLPIWPQISREAQEKVAMCIKQFLHQ